MWKISHSVPFLLFGGMQPTPAKTPMKAENQRKAKEALLIQLWVNLGIKPLGVSNKTTNFFRSEEKTD